MTRIFILFGWFEWFVFVFLWLDVGSAWSPKEHEWSEWHEFLFYSVDSSDSCSFSYGWMRGLLEVLRNTNCPNNTNLCLFGWFGWFVFVFLWLNLCSAWSFKEHECSEWHESLFIRLIRVIRGRFLKAGFGVVSYFVVIWKKRVRRLPRLRSILSI